MKPTEPSVEDIVRFQSAFTPIAAKYRQHGRVATWSMGAFACCVVSCFALPKSLLPLAWISGMLCWLMVLTAWLTRPTLSCPRCHNDVEKPRFGSFCPECGNNDLTARTWFARPRCGVCGKRMGGGKSRGYKIRVCTHCGLRLDEKGL